MSGILFLSTDIEVTSTMHLLLNKEFSTPFARRGRMTFVEDLDKNGERTFSDFSGASVRRR
jgi:hypothetical protein